MRHRSTSALVGVLFLALTAPLSALTAPAARAAEAPPVVTWRLDDGSPENVMLELTSDETPEAVDLIVDTGANGIRTFPMERLYAGTWAAGPLVLDELGSFPMTARITAADGSVTTAGSTLDYWLRPERKRSAISPVSLDRPDIEASGQFTFRDPRTRTTGPLVAGRAQVQVEYWGTVLGSADVAADGTYAVTVPVPEDWRAAYGGLPLTVRLATSGPVRPTFGVYPTKPTSVIWSSSLAASFVTGRLVLDATALRAPAPSAAVVAGVVQADPEGTGDWHPVPGARVTLQAVDHGYGAPPDGGVIVATYSAVAGSDGRFRATVRPGRTVTIVARADSPYLEQAGGGAPQDTLSLVVPAVSTLRWNAVSLTRDSVLHLSAELWPPQAAPARRRVVVQTSPDGRTGWRSLGWVPTDEQGAVSAEGWVARPSWKFRLVFAGDDGLQPATSTVVSRSLRETRVKAKVSATRVKQGGRVTLSGVVQKRTSDGSYQHVTSRKVVEVYFVARGGTRYAYRTYTSTDRAGKFSLRVKPKKDGYWLVAWFPPKGYVNGYSPELFVDVRPYVTSSSAAATLARFGAAHYRARPPLHSAR